MICSLFDLSHTIAEEYLRTFEFPWETLSGLGGFILETGGKLGTEYRQILPKVWVHESATVAPTAYLGAPCIICEGAEVRCGAFIRGCALVGKGCVVGNSTELKNAVLFDGVQIPHFNYVGDSLLGFRAHMGAGAIISNVKTDKSPVCVKDGEKKYETGLKKCGSFLGDFAEIGCNCVLNPGTVVGRHTSVYPLTSLRGVYPENSIVKNGNEIVKKH